MLLNLLDEMGSSPWTISFMSIIGKVTKSCPEDMVRQEFDEAQTLVKSIDRETDVNLQQLFSDIQKAQETHMGRLEATSNRFQEEMKRLLSNFMERAKALDEKERKWREGTFLSSSQ